MQFQKILCAVDFSSSSRGALEAAAALAKAGGALTLFTVLPENPVSVLGATAPGQNLSEVDKRQMGNLEKWAAEALEMGATQVVIESSRGDPAAQILQFAEDGRFELVVMGVRGQGGLLKSLLGSVSYKVVRSAVCSVLTVRAKSA